MTQNDLFINKLANIEEQTILVKDADWLVKYLKFEFIKILIISGKLKDLKFQMK